jgi:hypothetical protein
MHAWNKGQPCGPGPTAEVPAYLPADLFGIALVNVKVPADGPEVE